MKQLLAMVFMIGITATMATYADLLANEKLSPAVKAVIDAAENKHSATPTKFVQVKPPKKRRSWYCCHSC
jgi:hypothetical protein